MTSRLVGKGIGPNPAYFDPHIRAVTAWADLQNAYGNGTSFPRPWAIGGGRASVVREEGIAPNLIKSPLDFEAEAASAFGCPDSSLYYGFDEGFDRVLTTTLYDSKRHGVVVPLPSPRPVSMLFFLFLCP
jgi:hypothetical protein